MTRAQIELILKNGRFPGTTSHSFLLETHISWVILSPDFAFKIKKPVHLHFLDFSSLEQRRFFCQQELSLNRRLAPEMYLDILPIRTDSKGPALNLEAGEIIDYAVQMRRQKSALELDNCLHNGTASTEQMAEIAAVLAPFHLKNRIENPGTPTLLEDFEDLYTMRPVFKTIANKIALAEFDGLKQSIAFFLETHQHRLHERAEQQFWVDGHGDLHTRNIFMTQPPTIFDCVEFNPHYRRMDILNELAFLCMDLEFNRKPALADAFLQAYLKLWQVMPRPEDLQLFEYFKAYRANIRLKITLLELEIRPSELLVEVSKKYWTLLSSYARRLNTT
jgi:aminoglycoside phosphotransferase family enzyme